MRAEATLIQAAAHGMVLQSGLICLKGLRTAAWSRLTSLSRLPISLNPMVDVMFDSIKDLRTGEGLTVGGLPVNSVGWENIALTDGSFTEELGDVDDPLNPSQHAEED